MDDTGGISRKHVALMAIPAVCALLVLLARLHRIDLPFERDEGEYAYIAQMMLRGEAPYTEAYTMKLPGVPVWYAAFFIVFGETVRAAHLAALFADVVSAVAVAAFCRAAVMGDGRRLVVPVNAACWLLVLSTLLTFHGFIANCEKFAVASVTVGFALLVHTRRWWMLGLAAVAMGSALVCKQQVLPILPIFGLAAVFRDHGMTVTTARRVADGVLVSVGLLVPWLLTVVVVTAWGSFDAFWFQTVSYASAYVNSALYPLDHLRNAAIRYGTEPAVVFALIGVVVTAAGRVLTPRARLLVVAWFIASAVAVSIGLYFRPHYFVLAIPPLAIAGAVCGTRGRLTAALAAAVLLASIYDDRGALFFKTDNAVNKELFHQETFIESVKVAELLKRITRDDERILIIGNEPEILFMADRRSVTPYIYFYPLVERQPFAVQQQQELVDTVAANPPDHIVVQIKALRILERTRGVTHQWGVKLLQDYEIIWPPNSPRYLDRKTLERVEKPLYVLRRQGLSAPPSRPLAPGPSPRQ